MIMKLNAYAKKIGVHYRTAYRWFREGKLPGYQMPTGTIIVEDREVSGASPSSVAVYARVSSSENKDNLESQAQRLTDYCIAKGWQVAKIVKEVGSGVNDARPKLVSLLEDLSVGTIVVEHKDRLTRFGFNYIETLLKKQYRRIEVVNLAENGKEDLMQDLVAVIYSFSARMYGLRRAKRKTEKIIQELQDATG